jgi:APA family basic amino acid/polyamine antiporter
MTATLLIVASMIGTGIFTTTGLMVAEINSLPAILICWACGGVLALTGALSYAELATLYPENGGEYLFLSRIYHPVVGFIAGFASLVAGFSAPVAASAIAFAYYLDAVFPGIPARPVAIALIVILSALHAGRITIGSRFQNVFTFTKVILIAGLIIAGMLFADLTQIAAPAPVGIGSAVMSSSFAVGLVFVSFAYTGWNASIYISGEIIEPQRHLPRSLFFGTAIVTLLYLGLNIVFLSAVPATELAGVVEVGHVAAVALFGEPAARILSAMIAVGLISTIGAYIMTGPRVYEAMGAYFPRLGFLTGRRQDSGPIAAIVLQGLLAILLVLNASLSNLLTYVGLTLSLFAALTVAGVIVLRITQPDLPRPFRVPGYPLTPLLFITLIIWMSWNVIGERPMEAIAALATIVIGGGLYAALGARRN